MKIIGGCITILALTFMTTSAFADRAGSPGRIAPDSPLASDGVRLFAVTTDHTEVVARPLEGDGAWMVVNISSPLMRISGIAAEEGSLYVADSGRGTIYRVDLSVGTTHILPTLDVIKMGEIVVSNGDLLVADEQRGVVVALPLHGDLLTFRETTIQGNEFSFAKGMDVLLMSRAGLRTVETLSRDKAGEWRAQPVEDDKFTKKITFETTPRTAVPSDRKPSRRPVVERIGPVTTRDDIVYYSDPELREVFATPTQMFRPVFGGMHRSSGSAPGHLFATEHDLWVVDAALGDAIRRARPVPVEFTIEGQEQSECVTRLWKYLLKHDLLPVTHVHLDGNVERTLRAAGALPAPYVAAIEGVICDLNRGPKSKVCSQNKLRPVLQANTSIAIPNIRVESRLATRRVVLDGKRTVAQILDSSVFSPDFDYAKSANSLCELNSANEQLEKCTRDILTRRKGRLYLPVEVVKYVAAVPHADIPDGQPIGTLASLAKSCPDTRINSLERRLASAAQTPTTSEVDISFSTMLNTIKFDPGLVKQISLGTHVAVAEEEIDETHPDFRDTNGSTAFGQSDLTPDPPVESIEIRSIFEESDHGTAVAYLIGGRRNRLSKDRPAGLAPFSVLTRLPSALNFIEDAFTKLPNVAKTYVVNLSIQTPIPSDEGIRGLIVRNPTTLFVVAAGNTSRTDDPICHVTSVYPACLAEEENVLVVGATIRDGSALLRPTPATGAGPAGEGSNWSTRFVHIVAPGEGFVSAGRRSNDGSKSFYVPVRGTSFATPLATAVAAALVAKGIRDPRKVKARLIATADYEPGLSESVFAGRLNAKRALTEPNRAILVDKNQKEHISEIRGSPPTLTIDGYGPKSRMQRIRTIIRFDDVMRIQRTSATELRVLYQTSDGVRRLHGARIVEPDTVTISVAFFDSGMNPLPPVTERLDKYADFIASVQ